MSPLSRSRQWGRLLVVPLSLQTAILALTSSPMPVLAAPAKLTPEDAAGMRKPVQDEARGMAEAGDSAGAASRLDAAARDLGDPVLFIDAADAYYQQADKERDTAAANDAVERAKVALDILHYLRGEDADPVYTPVDADDVTDLMQRAEQRIEAAKQLIEIIESERESANLTKADRAGESDDEPSKPGRGKIIGGSVLTVVGIGMAGMGAAGLVLGNRAQDDAESPIVYGDAYDDAERRGKLANGLAIAGFAIGGAAVVVGVTLIALGVRDRNKARSGPDAGGAQARRPSIAPVWLAGGGGAVISSRF